MMMRSRPLSSLACTLVLACWAALPAPALSGAQDSPALPHKAEIIPGKLYAHVYAHTVPNNKEKIPCWSFVSEGLESVGQHEIVFTLRRPRGKDWPEFSRDLFGVFSRIRAHAEKGSTIEAYGVLSPLGAGTFLGSTGVYGLVFVPAEMFDGVEVPFQALAAVLAVGAEVQFMNKYSGLRLASLLGMASRYYPCPPWSEIGRKPVVSLKDVGTSALDRIQRILRPRGLSFRRGLASDGKERSIIVLRAELSFLRGLNDLLGDGTAPTALALMTEPDGEATSRLVWMLGGDKTGVIYAKMGSWVTGSFVAIVVTGDLEEAFVTVEDGVVLVMSPATWARVRASFSLGMPDIVPVGPKAVLQTEYVQTFPVDPLAPPCYTPRFIDMPRSKSEAEVGLGGSETLKGYVETFTAAARSALAGADRGDACGLLIAVGLKPGKKIRIWREAIEGTLPEATLKKLDETLARVLPIEVTGGPVAFVLKGPLWDRKVKIYPDLPAAWSDLKDAAGKPLATLEEIFRVIWPDERPGHKP